MVDLLGFITSILGQRQSADQFQKQLAETANESAADRALRDKLGMGQLDISKSQLAQSADQFTKDLALKQAAQSIGQQEFGQTFGLDQQRLAQAKAEAEAQQKLQQQQLLGNLGASLKSPDLLNLLGSQLGVPNLGYRTNLLPSGGTGSSGGYNQGPGGYQPSLPPSVSFVLRDIYGSPLNGGNYLGNWASMFSPKR